MDRDVGLQQEEKCLEAVYALQCRGWQFNGFTLLKAVRTYGHPRPEIRRFDGRSKADLIILFRHADCEYPLVLVLQVKSTHKSFRRFKNSPSKKNIKCIWIRPSEPLKFVMAELNRIFQEVFSLEVKKNPFLRRNLSKKTLKILYEGP